MTAEQILSLVNAAAATLEEALRLAGETRSVLSDTDQAVLDERLQSIRSQNDAVFARLDARLHAAEAGPGA